MSSGTEPLKNMHSFKDGAVHQYFSELFSEDDAQHVTNMFGSGGLLQRQWNHGDIREQFELGDHPCDR
jgi:hypothetical protein